MGISKHWVVEELFVWMLQMLHEIDLFKRRELLDNCLCKCYPRDDYHSSVESCRIIVYLNFARDEYYSSIQSCWRIVYLNVTRGEYFQALRVLSVESWEFSSKRWVCWRIACGNFTRAKHWSVQSCCECYATRWIC